MRVHVMGICGTFMAGIAVLAKALGYEVSGSDKNVYPPMSTQLTSVGITLIPGYEAELLPTNIDYVIVGNAISRGNPMMEEILNQGIPYISGPQWLFENVLHNRWVLAVSGTHGKTTTSSMLAWILAYNGKEPGYLIGGIPENFGVSAALGKDPFFVIEADEYDTAFFDKRSKFIHYHPTTLILNNLEFDHADIFSDLAAIQQQFHFLIRTVPGKGLIIHPTDDANIAEVLTRGCWTQTQTFGLQGGEWTAETLRGDGQRFAVYHHQTKVGEISWNLLGEHNRANALAAIAAAAHAGIDSQLACEALCQFKSVKRRLEIRGSHNGMTLYDDFAHHPTAITTTLKGLRAKVQDQRIIAIVEFGSYTMRSGVHKANIAESLATADVILSVQKNVPWDIQDVFTCLTQPNFIYADVAALIADLPNKLHPNDQIIVMSNSGFDGIHDKILSLIENASVPITE